MSRILVGQKKPENSISECFSARLNVNFHRDYRKDYTPQGPNQPFSTCSSNLYVVELGHDHFCILHWKLQSPKMPEVAVSKELLPYSDSCLPKLQAQFFLPRPQSTFCFCYKDQKIFDLITNFEILAEQKLQSATSNKFPFRPWFLAELFPVTSKAISSAMIELLAFFVLWYSVWPNLPNLLSILVPGWFPTNTGQITPIRVVMNSFLTKKSVSYVPLPVLRLLLEAW